MKVKIISIYIYSDYLILDVKLLTHVSELKVELK
jgi:hypothetical protein